MTMAHNAWQQSRVWAWLAIAAVSACFAPGALGASSDCAAAKKTYTTTCSMCHRANGKGYAAIKTADFTDRSWQAEHKDSELISAISNGVKGTSMVSFKDQLSAQQIKDLVDCVIRGFGNKSAPEHTAPKDGRPALLKARVTKGRKNREPVVTRSFRGVIATSSDGGLNP